ncbi:MAG: type 2 isopentenyl-diphosphate Delta-isomerase [Desulfurococcales archaeon]|nr:type 2 isopentenyl-diphosphate Delta-isomerase [Desulfurococcales archaeon]
MSTPSRKLEHIDIVLSQDVEGPGTTWLEYVHLIHRAAPEIDFEDVELGVSFLGKRLRAPIVITGMTGGHSDVAHINRSLAEAVEEFGIAMGVGSQRAAVEDPSRVESFSIARKVAPNAVLIANLGAPQLIKGYSLKEVRKAIEMIDADAIAIHLNPAQEVIQPEGEPLYRGLLKRLENIVSILEKPVIIKETGCGLSLETVEDLRKIGIKIIDVSGYGGTNWVLVEKYRAQRKGEELKALIASDLSLWGIPTAASIIEARYAAPEFTIIGSGGIRTSIDAAKALALGADLVGIAKPALEAYYSGRLRTYLKSLIHGIKAILFLTGSRNITELRQKPLVITGKLREWMLERKIDREAFDMIRRRSMGIGIL